MDSFGGLIDGPRARGAFALRTVMSPPWSLRILAESPLTVLAMVRGDAWVVPDQVSVTEASTQFTESGDILDPKLRDNLMKVGRQVARFSYLHTSEQALEFVRSWETAPQNPGGYPQ